MKFDRRSGILLHPTSLPGAYGIGDLGPQAHNWIDFLADSGCGLWQVLPLGPTGYGDSPYQCFSAFAGNPYLISPENLLEDRLIDQSDLAGYPQMPKDKVDYGRIIPWKLELLDRAYQNFQTRSSEDFWSEYYNFQAAQTDWLHDYALFMALKEAHGGGSWVDWPKPLLERQPEAIEKTRIKYSEAVERQIFRQFLFFRQWAELREHASASDIYIVGDIPIFVSHDSAEVWAHPELFFLDQEGKPTVVAGVPPDYFSKTGQLWGNPIYRWEVHSQDNYSWWIRRIRTVLQLVDIVRLDHFRGFAGYWEIPGDAETAEYGRWVPGPGKTFFRALRDSLDELPIIAEDLGVITPDVVELREHFNLPGMKVLVFAFYGDPSEAFLPHNHIKNCVVYTGTHDNDTARGWYERVSEDERAFYRRYLGRNGEEVAWDLIRTAWSSVADFAIAPLQDFLNLGNEARMNYPGNPSGNWHWRVQDQMLDAELQDRIKEINFLYDRDRLPRIRSEEILKAAGEIESQPE